MHTCTGCFKTNSRYNIISSINIYQAETNTVLRHRVIDYSMIIEVRIVVTFQGNI